MNDNVYPLNGSAFVESFKKRTEERTKTENEILEQLPIIQDIIKRIDTQITFYDSVSSIPDEFLVRPKEFMNVLAANKLTAKNLRRERDYIASKIKNLQ